jgi:magnesium transporter
MVVVATRWMGADGSIQSRSGDTIDPFPDEAPWAWIDVMDPDEAVLTELAARFGFHALALEDVRHHQSRPKYDTYEDGLFLVWLTPDDSRDGEIATKELDAFLGKRYLVTLHAQEDAAVEAVAADCARGRQLSPDWLLQAILDRLVDATLPMVDELGQELEDLENEMLENPRQEDLKALHVVRRKLSRLHRIVAPERDVLRGFVRETDTVGEEANRFFQNVGDHVARALDSIETYPDIAASAMDVYLSAQNNRMNEIMKQLTVVATIFMPLTLLSGIYGMNVLGGMWPHPLAWWSFWSVVGFMAAVGVAMALYFRKRNWW